MNPPTTQPRVFFLPGMQGQGPGDKWFVRGLEQAGFEQVTLENWTEHRWPIDNLRDRELHQRVAERFAEDISGIPESQPVIMIGHSTGAMVILDTMAMFDRPRLDQAWFLSAAVAKDFDLTGYLGGARRTMNVYSPLDWAVLSVGTKLFGTADGQQTDSAGFASFTGPGCADDRLEQIKYDPKWWVTGHYGGHLGPIAAVTGSFASKVIGPMIRDRSGDF